ncbi:MAG: hypothetical protein RIC56_02680 [Pseudomonadales bacterium]
MRDRLSLRYAFELVFALAAGVAALAVLQTFLIGRHFIIPTAVLAVAVVLGNVAWCGFRDQRWAKYLLFWCGFLATAHFFFALFWAKKYRELLGAAFEPLCVLLVLALGFVTWQYARRNRLFG